jgi:tetratricopeptide (TPR) repeat protein
VKVCAVGLLLLLAMAPLRSAQTAPASAGDLLQAYADRRFAEVDAILARIDNVGRVASELQHATPRWVSAEPSAARARRFVAAAVAVELAGRQLDARDAQRILIPWAAELLATQPPDERERAWFLTANALVQRTYDHFFLPRYGGRDPGVTPRGGEPHWDFPPHALARFPQEDRFHLAAAIDLELASWRSVNMQRYVAALRPGRSTGDAGKSTLREVAGAFEKLLLRQSIAADVHLRLGQTYIRLGRFEDALKQLNQIDARTSDPFLIYLSRYVTGVARRAAGDPAGAAGAFASALEAVPHAQSAAMALASLTLAADKPADAYALVRSAVARAGDVDDPWRHYPAAEYRLWHAYVAALRTEVR